MSAALLAIGVLVLGGVVVLLLVPSISERPVGASLVSVEETP